MISEHRVDQESTYLDCRSLPSRSAARSFKRTAATCGRGETPTAALRSASPSPRRSRRPRATQARKPHVRLLRRARSIARASCTTDPAPLVAARECRRSSFRGPGHGVEHKPDGGAFFGFEDAGLAAAGRRAVVLDHLAAERQAVRLRRAAAAHREPRHQVALGGLVEGEAGLAAARGDRTVARFPPVVRRRERARRALSAPGASAAGRGSARRRASSARAAASWRRR